MDDDQPQPSSSSPVGTRESSPLLLSPCPPPKPGQIRHLAVRTKAWQKQSRSRRLLQPSAPAEEDGSSSSSSMVSYILEKELHTNPMTGATIILATPVRLGEEAVGQESSDGAEGGCLALCCGVPVVVKVMPRPSAAASGDDGENPYKEIAAQQLLQRHMDPSCHHVVPLLDCLQDEESVYLVFPYLSGGDLLDLVEATNATGPLLESEVAGYFHQAVEALLFMKQSSALAHHDVSLENMMLDHKGRLMLIDLGMCIQAAEGESYVKLNHSCGKLPYMSPQVARLEAFDPFAADIWSLGVCLCILLTSRPLYRSPADHTFKMLARGQIREVLSLLESGNDEELSYHARDLICRMLDPDPNDRPTLEEVLLHPFLTGATRPSPSLPFQAAAALHRNSLLEHTTPATSCKLQC